jgi:hypothetical protein
MHHDNDGGTGDKRFKLKIRHIILAVFAVLLLAAVGHMAILSSGANRRLEALRAAGQPTSLAEFALRNKLPMGMENAAPVYESAFVTFVPPPADVNIPFVGKKTVPLDRGAAFPEPMAKAAADCLAANEKCLALLHEAAGIESCRYEYDYRQGYPRFQEMRSCGQLLKLATVHHALTGNADAAVGCIQDALRLSDSVRNEPWLLSHLVHCAYTGLAITGLERALSLTAFTDSQLRDLDEALAVTAGRIDLVHALVTERCSVIDRIQDPSIDGMKGPGAAILKLPGIRSQGLIDMLDYLEACIQAAGLPPVQRMARFEEIEKDLFGLSHLHLLAKIVAPALARVSVLDSRAHAHMDLARTGLAVERYRLATGKLPEQLTDLVPAYLSQVPTDPFDGQPIRYRRTEPGYVVYSVTDDGKDNGGKEREDVGKNEPYDLCFIVVR